MILLDEIVLIGDQKEIYFLEQLTDESNKKIRIKAEESLRLLNERIARKKTEIENNDAHEYELLLDMMELEPPKDSGKNESDMFEIDFELSPDETETEDSPPAKNGWFTSMFSKLIKKTS